MADILPGTSLSIADDIVIGGVTVFVRGEPVVVEQVSPNAADPSFRYVVFSQIMNTRYQLRDADLVREVEPVDGTGINSTAAPPADREVSAGWSRRGLIVTLVVIAVVIITGAAVATVVVGRKKNPEISGGQKSTLTTGIASSQTAQARMAGEILQKSASAIAAASSVKMDMTVQTQVNGTNVSGQMQIEQVEKGASGTESMMTGVFEGRESVIYVIGSTAYICTNGSWVKSGLPLLPDPGGPGGAEMGSLSRLQEYLRAAPSPTVVGEDAISYVITFNLGPDYFTREIDRLRALGADPGQAATAASANRDVELTFTISKANYLVSEVKEKVVTHGVQAGGDVLTEMDFKLYGYDTPISIIVPPEAQNAPEVPLPGY